MVFFVFWLIPPTRFFAFKRRLLCWCGADIGVNVRISSSARFLTTGNISIGDNTWIGHECLIIGGGADVSIGANCDLGPRISLVTGTHVLMSEGISAAGDGHSEAIFLEDGVWIGASVTVLGGVTIGAGSMVAAGSLVRENVPANTVVAGVPAKVVRTLRERSLE